MFGPVPALCLCLFPLLARRLDDGIPVDNYPVLRFLPGNDFLGLLRYAAETGYREDPEGYFSKCRLCVDIRKHLVSRGEFKELQPKEFYSQLI